MAKFASLTLSVALSTAFLAGCGSTSGLADASSSTLNQNQSLDVLADNGITRLAEFNEGGIVDVHREPTSDSPITHQLENPRKSASVDATFPLVLPIIPEPTAPQGWLRVRLPVQPNGSSGWIKDQNLIKKDTPYRIEIVKDDFNLKVFKNNIVIVDETVGIGKGASETPEGSFFITELVASVLEVYGPFAYGLSGYSEQLSSFQGTDPVIGIHGTNNPNSIGKEVSSGCVRLPNDVITEMTTYLPLGTPVEIR